VENRCRSQSRKECFREALRRDPVSLAVSFAFGVPKRVDYWTGCRCPKMGRNGLPSKSRPGGSAKRCKTPHRGWGKQETVAEVVRSARIRKNVDFDKGGASTGTDSGVTDLHRVGARRQLPEKDLVVRIGIEWECPGDVEDPVHRLSVKLGRGKVEDRRQSAVRARRQVGFYGRIGNQGPVLAGRQRRSGARKQLKLWVARNRADAEVRKIRTARPDEDQARRTPFYHKPRRSKGRA